MINQKPGSNMTNLFAPIKLRPQPPAFDDNINIKLELPGSLNSSTIFPLL